MKKNKGGRPTVMTPEIVAKLEQAFAIDATVEEACSYADISRDAFYDHLKREPRFSDRIAELRQRPVLKARQTVVKSLDTPQGAQWYLARKRKNEFAERLENTGADGVPLVITFDSALTQPPKGNSKQ
jgi:hypothetical protein